VQQRHARQRVNRPAVERCDNKGTVGCGSQAAGAARVQQVSRTGQGSDRRSGDGRARLERSQPRHGHDSGSARRTAMIAWRGSTVQGEQALGPRRPDVVTTDTSRNRVLHDFWCVCFLDFTVALWPVQVTSPKLALRTTTFIQALPGFEELAGKNRGPNIDLSGCAAWRGRHGQNRSTSVKTALPPPRC